jgi:hypothetical protein
MNDVLVISIVLMIWTTLTIGLQTHGSAALAMWASASGLLSQLLWIVFDLLTGAYGLLPLALILGVLYVRGWLRWRTVRPEVAT